MTAGVYNLLIEQGATFKRQVLVRTGSPPLAVDLTGYTAKMQVRSTVSAADPAPLTLTHTAGLTLGGAAGTIDIRIEAAQTDPWPFKTAVYDLEITSPDGTVTRLLKGTVTVDQEVTR